MRQLIPLFIAAASLSGCMVLPHYGHLRPVTKSQANPHDLVCLKTDYFKPCTLVRREHLRMMPALRGHHDL